VTNQQEIYRDGEPVLFDIIFKWHNLYFDQDALVPELQSLGKIDEKINVRLKFTEQQPFTSEKERLEVIEKRRDLGLDSLVDSILRDNPDYTREDAIETLRRIFEERLLEQSLKLKEMYNNSIPIKAEKEEENKEEGEDGIEGNLQTEAE
jgi:hypothetical protein